MSYVLRFCNNDGAAGAYFGADPQFKFERRQRDARRFPSADEARLSVPWLTQVGSGGPEDLCGWKVIRLVKK